MSSADRFPRTDSGNAELIAAKFRDTLRFDHRCDRWLVWNGARWVEDTDGEVLRRAKLIARIRLAAARNIKDEDARKQAIGWALRSESRFGLSAAIELAKVTEPLSDPGDSWDMNPFLLGVENGVVDLKTGELRAACPTDRLTMQTPVKFDPRAACPRFEQFLREVFLGDAAVIGFVQRALGYCLTGSISEQCVFLCYGQGANGKSTFLETVRHVVGGYASNLPFSAFELDNQAAHAHELAGLVAKRFVTASETNENARLNEARIKSLTGGEPVTARFLYGEYFTYDPTAKFWLAFNHKPVVSDVSHGFWRRIRLIPFLAQFDGAKRDPRLLDRLKAEAGGILAWAVRGCLLWQKDGLEMPAAVQVATQEYRQESDPVAEFVDVYFKRSPDGWVSAASLQERYRMWSEANGVESLRPRSLADRLRAIGLVSSRMGHDRTRGWQGIREKELSELQEESGADVRTDADTKIQ